jgi:hypothetical protein
VPGQRPAQGRAIRSGSPHLQRRHCQRFSVQADAAHQLQAAETTGANFVRDKGAGEPGDANCPGKGAVEGDTPGLDASRCHGNRHSQPPQLRNGHPEIPGLNRETPFHRRVRDTRLVDGHRPLQRRGGAAVEHLSNADLPSPVATAGLDGEGR